MIEEELRDMCNKIRTRPTPIKDIIPLLQRAANELEHLRSMRFLAHNAPDFKFNWE